jgi:hypothetical protein
LMCGTLFIMFSKIYQKKWFKFLSVGKNNFIQSKISFN